MKGSDSQGTPRRQSSSSSSRQKKQQQCRMMLAMMLALVVGASAASSASPCMEALPRALRLSKEERQSFCGSNSNSNSNSNRRGGAASWKGGVACLKASAKARGLIARLGKRLLIDLCAHAHAGTEDALCAQKVPSGFSPTEIVTLCMGSRSAANTLECARGLQKLSRTISTKDIALLCSGTVSQGPLQCFAAARKNHIEPQFAVSLCTGAASEVPVQCILEMPAKLRKSNMPSLVKICHRASTNWPVSCVTRAHPVAMKLKLGVKELEMLCGGAESDGPGKCLEAARKFFQRSSSQMPISLNEMVHLCAHDGDPGIIDCLLKSPRWINAAGLSSRLCSRAKSAEPAKCASSLKRHPCARGNVSMLAALCAGAQDDEVQKCASSFPPRMDCGMLTEFCSPAAGPTQAATSCLTTLAGSSNKVSISNGGEALQLCKGAHSDAPLQCALAAPRSFPGHLIARLCSHARTEAPGKCAAAAFPRIVDDMDTVVDLCRNVPRTHGSDAHRGGHEKTSNFGPLKCYGHITADISGKDKAILCQGAMTAAPAECTRSLSFSTRSSVKIQLCARARDIFPAKCANSMPRRSSLSHDELAMLCNRATSLGPRDCFMASPAALPRRLRIDLCHTAKDEGPATCSRAAQDQRLDPSSILKLCKNVHDASPVDCLKRAPSQWPMRRRVELCAPADGKGGGGAFEALKCLSSAPSWMQQTAKLALCKSGNHQAALCARAMPSRFSDMHVLQMCSNATSNGPARCALAMQAQRKAKNSLISKLCSSATTDVPAQCALDRLAHGGGGGLDEQTVSICKFATLRPSIVEVMQGPKKIDFGRSPGQPILLHPPIVARVLSQYGKIITDQDAADVGLEMPRLVITVRSGRETSTHLSGSKVVSKVGGAYTFDKVSIHPRVPGVLWLKLSLPDSESRAGLWPLYVSGTIARDDCAGGGEASGCDALYSMFVSVKGDGDDGKRCGQEHFCATLSGWKPVMLALACRGVLIDEGVTLEESYVLRPFLKVRIAKRSIGRLKASLDVPVDTMSPRTVLGLASHGDIRPQMLRKAYRSKSLEWHPDKWAIVPSTPSKGHHRNNAVNNGTSTKKEAKGNGLAQFDACVRHAQRCFEIVVEAFSSLK
eukprot:g3532.t1